MHYQSNEALGNNNDGHIFSGRMKILLQKVGPLVHNVRVSLVQKIRY
jgi:hypothetical protein